MNLSLVLGHSKKYVVVRDHSGACCGDSRPEYVGELGIGIISEDIILAALQYRQLTSPSKYKRLLTAIVEQHEELNGTK